MTPNLNGRLSAKSMAFVLAGGRGSRLKELTDNRVKPAVFFGGKVRIIDFALSNALNSGIRKMSVATQYKAHSLIRHCQRVTMIKVNFELGGAIFVNERIDIALLLVCKVIHVFDKVLKLRHRIDTV